MEKDASSHKVVIGTENGVSVTKPYLRQKVWEYMEKNDIAVFPRPVYHRIPNFKGAQAAAQLLSTLPEFQSARTVKVSPDKPQEEVRFIVLQQGKDLIVPTPGLIKGLFNRLAAEPGSSKERLRQLASRQGIDELSKQIPMASRLKIDLVVDGSVAVDVEGRRLGKGEGFSDLEFAMAASHHGAVSSDTIVVTTVHDVQVFDDPLPDHLFSPHDLTVDIIVTPTRIIRIDKRLPKPDKIMWGILTREKFEKIPVLKEIQYREMKTGRDVRLKDDLIADNGVIENGPGKKATKSFGHKTNKKGSTYQKLETSKTTEIRKTSPQQNGHLLNGDSAVTGESLREGNIVPKKSLTHKGTQHKSSASGRHVSFFIGKIPRSARVKDLKESLAQKELKILNIAWKGPKGFAFVDVELGLNMTEEDLLTRMQDLKLCDVQVNVERDRGHRGLNQESLQESQNSFQNRKHFYPRANGKPEE